jgi:hypothetical protein
MQAPMSVLRICQWMIRAKLKDLGGEDIGSWRAVTQATRDCHAGTVLHLLCWHWRCGRRASESQEHLSTFLPCRTFENIYPIVSFSTVSISHHHNPAFLSLSIFHRAECPPGCRRSSRDPSFLQGLDKPPALSWTPVAKPLPLPIASQTMTRHGLTSSEVQVVP